MSADHNSVLSEVFNIPGRYVTVEDLGLEGGGGSLQQRKDDARENERV